MVSSKSQINTRSVVDSGVVGETVFVRLPLPLVVLVSGAMLLLESRDLLAVSTFMGEVGLSFKPIPFDGLSINQANYKVNLHRTTIQSSAFNWGANLVHLLIRSCRYTDITFYIMIIYIQYLAQNIDLYHDFNDFSALWLKKT